VFPEVSGKRRRLAICERNVFDSCHRYQWIDDRFTVDTESGNGRIDVALPQVDNAVAFYSRSVSKAE
jgi:hypothetical protein